MQECNSLFNYPYKNILEGLLKQPKFNFLRCGLAHAYMIDGNAEIVIEGIRIVKYYNILPQ
jgi:hypothetical protein